MTEEAEIIEIKPKNMYMPICIVQAICVAVILVAVIIVKMFFNNSYIKLEKWCQNTVFEKTEITANFNEDASSEI